MNENDLYKSVLLEYNRSNRLVPLVFIGPHAYRFTDFGLRMRPHKFTTTLMVNNESPVRDFKNISTEWIASPSLGHSTVMAFESSNLTTSKLYQRFLIDFRNIPAANPLSDGVWIEVVDRNMMAIGRFPSRLEVTDNIKNALRNNLIQRPNTIVEFTGTPHPPFMVQQQENNDIIWIDPDLRFDDEIEAQGLESPVRS